MPKVLTLKNLLRMERIEEKLDKKITKNADNLTSVKEEVRKEVDKLHDADTKLKHTIQLFQKDVEIIKENHLKHIEKDINKISGALKEINKHLIETDQRLLKNSIYIGIGVSIVAIIVTAAVNIISKFFT